MVSACDVFLSYSWADNPSGPGGAHWADRFRLLLQTDLERTLGRKPNIFLDETDIQNGPVVDSLRRQLESAGAFVAIVSDAWLNATSWCRWELSHFRSSARLHPEGPDSRISKVMLSPLSDVSQLQQELINSPEYRFYGRAGREQSGPPNTFAVSELAELADYKRLLTNLTATLQASDDSLFDPVTAYIADIPPTPEWRARRDRLFMDLRKNRIRPVCETRWPGADPNKFEQDIGTRMTQVNASIHLLAPVAESYGSWPSQAEMELEKALEVTERVDQRPLRIFLWSDSKDSTPRQWEAILERAKNIRQVDSMLGKTWEYTLSNIQCTISSKRNPDESPFQAPSGDGAIVFVQCLEEDRAFARTIRDKLAKKGHRVDFLPQPKGWVFRKRRTGEDEQRQVNYERYYRKADGLLVIHGNGNATELWLLVNCDAIRDYLKDELRKKVRGVCLTPPEETKDFQDHDDPTFPNYFLSQLDDFERRLPRRS